MKTLESMNFNFDNPTPEETERQRAIADSIYFTNKYRYDFADINLRDAKDCDNLNKKINWLKKIGYDGVNIPNNPKPVSFTEAIKLGYSKNIYAMFNAETNSLKKMKKQASKYVFNKPA